MAYDLVIRNGTVVDGSGQPRFRADVGVVGKRIARIGRIDEHGKSEIDAEGLVVTPGFIDGHTHMDAQVFWDPLGSNSCWHGVTSVVMGNCGFTLAPSRPGQQKLVTDNLERAEDIPAKSMAAGIDWSWESFPEFLDAVEAQPKAINYASQIGHSALRTYAMGERAFTEKATEGELEIMIQALREALRAGAIGFSSSVSDAHQTPDGRPVASRMASWDELSRLVEVVGEEGGAVFELATETELTEREDPETAKIFYNRFRDLAVATRVPSTYGMRAVHVQAQVDMLDETAAAGGKMFGQTLPAYFVRVYCFKANTPFDNIEGWKPFRSAPVEEKIAMLRNPERRAALVRVVAEAYADPACKIPRLDELKLKREGRPDEIVTIAAKAKGVDPMEYLLDVALETDLELTFGRIMSTEKESELLTAMRHPRTIMTFSDSGAHVSYMTGADLQTIFLSRWVRERQEFSLEEGVSMITLVPALAWQVPNRGLIAEGMVADLNVFDPETIAPGVPKLVNDLPAGSPRFRQQAIGIHSTVVGGQEVFRNGEHTGALPGELMRYAHR